MESSEYSNYFKEYRSELITLMHKSQDEFEKQLSYISAGCLVLSIGFIKDVIKNIQQTCYHWLLPTGWILLAATLLINLLSHMVSSNQLNSIIKDIDEEKYEQKIAVRKIRVITYVNWISITTLLLGILAIIIFITFNI